MAQGSRLAGPDRDRAVLARFPSKCEACRRPIEPGAVIAPHRGQWLHERCSAAREAIARAVEAELAIEEGGQ